jgi:hypothetical protein
MSTADIWNFARTRLPQGWNAALELPGHVIVSRGGHEVGRLAPTRGGALEAMAFTEAETLDNPVQWFTEGPDDAAFDAGVAWIDAQVEALR